MNLNKLISTFVVAFFSACFCLSLPTLTVIATEEGATEVNEDIIRMWEYERRERLHRSRSYPMQEQKTKQSTHFARLC